VYLKSPFQT